MGAAGACSTLILLQSASSSSAISIGSVVQMPCPIRMREQNGDDVVAADVQKRIRRRQFDRGGRLREGEAPGAGDDEGDDQTAGGNGRSLEEVAPRDVRETHRLSFHALASSAARWTAARMR